MAGHFYVTARDGSLHLFIRSEPKDRLFPLPGGYRDLENAMEPQIREPNWGNENLPALVDRSASRKG